MNVPVLLRKLQAATSSKPQPGHMKWSRHGETITGGSYEVTEWEIKTHQRLQAQSVTERYSR